MGIIPTIAYDVTFSFPGLTTNEEGELLEDRIRWCPGFNPVNGNRRKYSGFSVKVVRLDDREEAFAW